MWNVEKPDATYESVHSTLDDDLLLIFEHQSQLQ